VSIHSSLRLRLQGLYYNLGCVLQQQGQLVAATDNYYRAIALQQADAEHAASARLTLEQIKVYNNLGCVLVQQERWQEAIQIYQQAIQLQPDQGILYNNLGRVLFRQDPTEAIVAYRRAIRLEPGLAIAHHNLGLALQNQNQHQAALHCFQQVMQLEPNHVTVHSDSAVSWLALGQFESMLNSLRLAILPHREMIAAYCAQSDYPGIDLTVAQADALLTAKASCGRFLMALMQEVDSSLLYELLAQTYENWANVLTTYGGSEQYQRAEQYYQKALKLQPNKLSLLLRLSDCLARQGLTQPDRQKAAVFSYYMALALYPTCPDLYRQLGQVLEQQQQFASAIECYQKALALNEFQAPAVAIPTLPKSVLLITDVYDSAQNWAVANPQAALYIPVEIPAKRESTSRVQAAPRSDAEQPEDPTEQPLLRQLIQPEVQPEVQPGQAITESSHLTASLKAERQAGDPVPESCIQANCTQENCAGLNCAACLKQIWNWFNPLYLGEGLHDCMGESHCPEVPRLDCFVAVIPQGKTWIVPQQNAWMVCNAVAILTVEDWLLADLCRAYPSQLPTCQHSAPPIAPVLAQTECPALETLEGRVVVLSSLSGNTYFHWMVDVLPRLELLRLSGIDLETIDWFLVNSTRHSFQRETLEQLGIPASKIIASDQHPYIQATELIVPAFSGHFGWLEDWALSFLRQTFQPTSSKISTHPAAEPDFFSSKSILSQGLRYAIKSAQADLNHGCQVSLQVSAALPERIYITRSDANHRRVLNEAQVLEQITPLGFVPVELEALSFQQQVDLFAHAKVILAPHGSGLTNLIFCQSAATVVEFVSPHYIRHYYWVISRLLGLKHYFLVGEVLPCYPVRELMYQNPLIEDIWINIDSLKTTLARIGLASSLCPA
jgi:tetratricopeptide (TPR) repeat protein/capsular polysaccharide biosynthesis protein